MGFSRDQEASRTGSGVTPTLPLLPYSKLIEQCAVRVAHADLIGRLALTTPHRIVVYPDAADFEERAAHLNEVISHFKDYLLALASDTAENMTGGRDRQHMEATITNALDDLASDLSGTIEKEAGRLAP